VLSTVDQKRILREDHIGAKRMTCHDKNDVTTRKIRLFPSKVTGSSRRNSRAGLCGVHKTDAVSE